MSVLLRIGNYKAILRAGEWRCAHQPLETALNDFTRHWIHRAANSSELQGNLELKIASAVEQHFKGRVGLRLGSERARDGHHYVKLRQMNLFDSWNS